MRLALPVLMLLAAPALAQQQPPSPAVQAYQIIAHQAIEREVNDLIEILNLRQQIDTVTKERDALKAKPDAK